jgi:glycosyltransferase involved in cell wall biosynthesis
LLREVFGENRRRAASWRLEQPLEQEPTNQGSVGGAPALRRSGVFVVVPAYNEAAGIEHVLRDLTSAPMTVVLVDDGSSDATSSIAGRFTPHVVRHLVNRGQGAALQTGIEFALRRGALYIVTFDADGQHRVDDIAALIAPLAAGECDVTLGSRFLGQAIDIPRLRVLALKTAVLGTRLLSGMRLTDAHNGFRAFTRRAAQRIRISMDRMAHASELVDLIRREGFRYLEVPVEVRYTSYSLAKGQRVRDAVRTVSDYILDRLIG